MNTLINLDGLTLGSITTYSVMTQGMTKIKKLIFLISLRPDGSTKWTTGLVFGKLLTKTGSAYPRLQSRFLSGQFPA